MSQSASALLVFGYNLGGDDQGWLIHEIGDYGEPDPARISWLTPEPDNPDDDWVDENFGASLGRRLKEGNLIEPTIIGHGYEYAESALVMSHKRVDIGEALSIDRRELLRTYAIERQLAEALQQLDITPLQKKPEWLILVCYG